MKMKDIRIVFMGTPKFSCGILDTLIEDGYNVVACVSQPDKKVGRKQILQATPVKEKATIYNIPIIQPIKIKDDYKCVLEYKPDLIVTCAYGQLIPEELLNYPKFGCINVHASLLPKYRGGAPIHMAVINGEKETGITIMYMVKKMDAGAIISQDKVQIDIQDTTSDMYDKLEVCGKNLLTKTLPLIISNEINPIDQDESLVTFAPNISKEQEFISFNDIVLSIYNHIRGLISWPVGYGVIEGKKVKFHKVQMLTKKHDYPNGQLVKIDNNVLGIACINGFIILEEVQVEGKSKMNVKDFCNGIGRTLVGSKFE